MLFEKEFQIYEKLSLRKKLYQNERNLRRFWWKIFEMPQWSKNLPKV
jgi:hypothetical protein